MFNNLVESDSHKEDYKRKTSFFLYTLAGYAVLTLAAGVASIYAYDAHLENQNTEFMVLLAPSYPDQRPVRDNDAPKPKAGLNDKQQVPERDVLIARISDSTKPPDKISAVGSTTPEMPPGPVALTGRIFDPGSYGDSNGLPTPGSRSNSDNGGNRNLVKIEEPPPPRVEPPPAPKKVINIGSLITSHAISLPKPPYPAIAKAVHASGPVTVQILLDETGKVISARATSGHPLLQDAAVKAAYQARFSPTILTGQPVKVSGLITYNFMPQ
jgi:periplasmic protein TonB